MIKYILKSIICLLILSSSGIHAANFSGPAWPLNTVPYFYRTDAPLTPEAKASFEAAVNYYNNNTSIRFVEATGNNDPLYSNYTYKLHVYGISDASAARSYAWVGYWKSCFILLPSLCNAPHVHLAQKASPYVAIHELFHVLGFEHEQKRADRDDFITIDWDMLTASGYNSGDYSKSLASKSVGAFDFESIENYKSGIYLSINNTPAIESYIKEPRKYEGNFKIAFNDATPDTVFDNPTLNIENIPLVEITPLPNGYTSGNWDFIYQGNNSYSIRNTWIDNNDKFLVDLSNTPGVKALTSAEMLEAKNQWVISFSGNKAQIKNKATGKFLIKAGNALSYTDQSSLSQWYILATPSYRAELSIMDQVALHWAYGHPFRIQQSDDTPSIADNKTLHVEHLNSDDSIDIETLPLSNNANYWYSAMWTLVKKGEYFMIKNLWTNEYIEIENGIIQTSPDGSLNDDGVEINGWYSAYWELEIHANNFRIRNAWTGQYLFNNNSKLGLTINPSDASANWDFSVVDWDTYQ